MIKLDSAAIMTRRQIVGRVNHRIMQDKCAIYGMLIDNMHASAFIRSFVCTLNLISIF